MLPVPIFTSEIVDFNNKKIPYSLTNFQIILLLSLILKKMTELIITNIGLI